MPGAKRLLSFFSPFSPASALERKQAVQALLHVATLARDSTQLPAAVMLTQPPCDVLPALCAVVSSCAAHWDAVRPVPLGAMPLAKLKGEGGGEVMVVGVGMVCVFVLLSYGVWRTSPLLLLLLLIVPLSVRIKHLCAVLRLWACALPTLCCTPIPHPYLPFHHTSSPPHHTTAESIKDPKKLAAEIKKYETPKPSKLKLSDSEVESCLVYALGALSEYALLAPLRPAFTAGLREQMVNGVQRVVSHHHHITNRCVLLQSCKLLCHLTLSADRAQGTFFGWDFLDALSALLTAPASASASASTAPAPAPASTASTSKKADAKVLGACGREGGV